MKLGMQLGLDRSNIVLDGDPAPSHQNGGTAPKFSAHVCCSQTAGSIKMPLGTMVGLGPGNGPSSTPRGYSLRPTKFWPCLLWPNGWMDQNTTWYEGRSRLRPHCVTWGPSSPFQKWHSSPIFGPCLLWPNGRPSQLLLSTCYHI